jgi:tRNA (cmo5U34)-methyltransferase
MATDSHAEDSTGHDQIFSRERDAVADFDFGKETAKVFDNMLERSVPFYAEMQRMIGELVGTFAADNSSIWDLGCSTCNTFMAMEPRLRDKSGIQFVGLDNSEEMLIRARKKLMQSGTKCSYDLRYADLNAPIEVANASVVLSILTLQFVRPLYRERLLRDVFKGMNDNGCFILVEKVVGEDSLFNRLFIEYYYEYKRRNGYSDLEIAQKREALENVLIPYRLNENLALLQAVGFKSCEVFFKWYNFCGIVAVK